MAQIKRYVDLWLLLAVLAGLIIYATASAPAGTETTTATFKADDSTVEVSGGTLQVKDAGITSAKVNTAVAGLGVSGGGGSALAFAPSELTDVGIVNGDSVVFIDAGDADAPKKETLADLATLFAGNGISATASILAFAPSELTEVAIADGDYVLFTDTTDSNNPKKETLADLATLFAGDGLAAVSSVLAVGVDDSTVEINGDALRLKDGGVTVAKCAAAVQDLMPNLDLVGSDDGDGTGLCEITVRDAANNSLYLTQRFLIRVWIADAEWSEPDPQTGFTVQQGELMRTIEANADLEVISDDEFGTMMSIDAGGAKTVYVMAEIDGRIYSSGAINITVP